MPVAGSQQHETVAHTIFSMAGLPAGDTALFFAAAAALLPAYTIYSTGSDKPCFLPSIAALLVTAAVKFLLD